MNSLTSYSAQPKTDGNPFQKSDTTGSIISDMEDVVREMRPSLSHPPSTPLKQRPQNGTGAQWNRSNTSPIAHTAKQGTNASQPQGQNPNQPPNPPYQSQEDGEPQVSNKWDEKENLDPASLFFATTTQGVNKGRVYSYYFDATTGEREFFRWCDDPQLVPWGLKRVAVNQNVIKEGIKRIIALLEPSHQPDE